MAKELVVKSTGYIPDHSHYWRCNDHSNPHWELVLVQGNSLHFQRGNQYLLLDEGHFLLLWPNEVHRSYGDTPSSGGFYFAQFAANMETIGSRVHCRIADESIALPAHGLAYSHRVLKLFELIVQEAAERKQHYKLQVTTLFVEILIDLTRQHKPFDDQAETIHVTSPKKAEVVHRIRRFIETNYRKRLSAKDISQGVNLSYEYACRTFRQAMEMTIVEYTNYLRIEEARILLLELKEGQTIAQISEILGYNDPSYFSRVFRQMVGSSPSEYIRHAYGGTMQRDSGKQRPKTQTGRSNDGNGASTLTSSCLYSFNDLH
ncbi:MAG: helix-turn-helix transcriptional regulator [Limnochordia bacterium]|nr:AraC family transcriptional regulator [Limnochordia bacterium]